MAASALSGTRLDALIADYRDPTESLGAVHYASHPLRRPGSVLGTLAMWDMAHAGLSPGQRRRLILVVLAAIGDRDGIRALRALPDREIVRQAAADLDSDIVQVELRQLAGGEWARLMGHVAAMIATILGRVSSPGSHARAPRPRAARRTRTCSSRDGPSDPSASRPPRHEVVPGAVA